MISQGLLLPESILHSAWFGALSTFVAVNTVIFLTLAIVKIMPVMHPGRWFQKPYLRAQTRSIYPDAVEVERSPRARLKGFRPRPRR